MIKTLMVLIFICAAGNAAAQTPAPVVPDFTFYKLNKTPFTPKDLAVGKKLFFVFFDADCEHCQRVIAYMGKHYNSFKNVPVYLITLDDDQKRNIFMDKFGSKLKGKKNITALRDKDAQFINKFKPRKYPSMFLYSSDRKLIMYDDDDKAVANFEKAINKK